MRQYVWVEPGIRVRIMCGCVALIAGMVCLDGLLQGELLRMFLGGLVAWPFATFMVRGIPVSRRVVEKVDRQIDRAFSTKRGDNSAFFRWAMVGLGAALGGLAFLGAWAILTAAPDVLEASLPMVADDISRAEGGDWEMVVRLLYAAVFAVAGGALLLTAWVRFRG